MTPFAPGDSAALFAEMICGLADEAAEQDMTSVMIVLRSLVVAMELGEVPQLCRHVGEYMRGVQGRRRALIEAISQSN